MEMESAKPFENLPQDHLPAVVKEEPLEKEPEGSTFCYETVTKEEVILDDQVEHADDQPEAEGSNRPFKCSECNRTFDNVSNLNRCVKKHNTIRLELFKCELCGKCSGNRQNYDTHQAAHQKRLIKSQLAKGKPKDESFGVVKEENGLYRCLDCNRTYKQRSLVLMCSKRHMAKRLGLYQCKFCHLRAGSAYDLRRHELKHKPKNTEPLHAVEAGIAVPEQEVPVVKKELPEEPEGTAFCYETVTKEEVILDDEHVPTKVSKERIELLDKSAKPDDTKNYDRHEAAHKKRSNKTQLAKGKPKDESLIASPAEVVMEENGQFKCSECDRTYKQRSLALMCSKRHLAKRLGLYQCKFCHLRTGSAYDLRRHELKHKPNSEPLQAVEAAIAVPEQEVPVVKKELPEEPEGTAFCYETVTKEEVNLEDPAENVSVSKKSSGYQSEVSKERPFKCSECNRTFASVSRRNRCVKKHNAIKLGLYKCKRCGKCFGTKQEQARHKATHKKGPNQEDISDSEASEPEKNSSKKKDGSIDSIEKVIKAKINEPNECNDGNTIEVLKDENGLFKCPECDRSYKERYMATKCFKRHVARRLGLYQCKLCNWRTGTVHELRKHNRRHNPVPPECSVKRVKKELPDDSERSSRPETVTKEKEIQASQNESASENPSGSATDVSKQHPFKCSECNKRFGNLVAFQRCERRCKNIRLERYKCKTCGRCCASKYTLAKHEEYHRNATQHKKSKQDQLQESDRPFKCSECYQTFYQQYLADQCEKKHTAVRLGLYECKFCKQRLGTSRSLNKHELAHKKRTEPKVNKQRRFACDLCEKRFIHKASITKHMRSQHSGELRFTCHRCNVKFETRPELITHVLRHDWDETKYKYFAKLVQEDDGNYLCTICNRKFIYERTGRDHVFRHMNIIEALFECKTCGMKCGNSYEYKIHNQIHAKPEEVPETSDGNSPSVATNGNPSKESDAAEKSKGLDCKICRKRLLNKHSLERHEIVHRKHNRRKQTSGEAAEKGSKVGQQPNEPGSSSFCYETVTKEELIIEEDDRGEDKQQEDSRNSLEDHQPMEDESRESLAEQSEPTENKGIAELKDTELLKEDHIDQHLPKDSSQIQCDICQKNFDDTHSLSKHYERHKKGAVRSKYLYLLVQEEECYRCLLCDNTFKRRDKALAHIQRHMSIIEGNFQCKVCGLRCGANSDYQLHIKTHKSTSDQRALPREIEGVHSDYASSSNIACEKSDLPLHCKTCNVFFNNKTNLNVHLWTSKLRIIRSKTSTTEGELSDGNDKQVEPKVRPQSEPRTAAAEGNPPGNDKQVKHKARKRKLDRLLPRDDTKICKEEDGFYKCSKCDYKSDNPSKFRRHRRGHRALEMGVYTCDICQMRFPDKEHLFYHKKTHQKDRIECLTCHEKFQNRGEFFRHQVIHTKNVVSRQFMEQVTKDEKGVFTCPFCGKTHNNRSNAYQHFRGHVTDRFMCGICQKRCTCEKDLRDHMNSHEKLRFRCRICKGKFETRQALYRHKNTHKSNLKVFLGMDDDLYHCTRCDETFESRNRALSHFKEHRSRKKETNDEADEDQASEESDSGGEDKDQ